MSPLFTLAGAVEHDARIDAWFDAAGHEMRLLVRPWFERVRGLGPDVREILHDNFPTACVGDAAFVYVNAFAAHAAIGFFQGADLADPAGLLEGAGKRMRHVKIRWGQPVDEAAVSALVEAAYGDIRARVAQASQAFPEA